MSTSSRRCACAVALTAQASLIAVLPSNVADAAVDARAVRAAGVSTSRWAAVAVNQGAAATTGGFAVDWSVNEDAAYSFMDAVNTGTLPLIGQSYTLTTVPTQEGNTKIPTITLDACVGGSWNPVSNTCPGTVTSMGAAASGSFTSTVPLAVGARLSIRVLSDGPPGASFLTTISITIARTQVRAGTVSNG
jgi:hypothetical protein